MTGIGDLNRRLVLEAPVETADGEGGVTRLYDVVTTLWAQVMPLSARADVAADSLGAALRYRNRHPQALRRQHAPPLARWHAHLPHPQRRESADRRFLEIDAEERED